MSYASRRFSLGVVSYCFMTYFFLEHHHRSICIVTDFFLIQSSFAAAILFHLALKEQNLKSGKRAYQPSNFMVLKRTVSY